MLDSPFESAAVRRHKDREVDKLLIVSAPRERVVLVCLVLFVLAIAALVAVGSVERSISLDGVSTVRRRMDPGWSHCGSRLPSGNPSVPALQRRSKLLPPAALHCNLRGPSCRWRRCYRRNLRCTCLGPPTVPDVSTLPSRTPTHSPFPRAACARCGSRSVASPLRVSSPSHIPDRRVADGAYIPTFDRAVLKGQYRSRDCAQVPAMIVGGRSTTQ